VPGERAFVRDVVLPTVLRDGRWEGELHFRHFRTGDAIPVLYRVFRIDDPVAGAPTHFATFTRDLRERRAGERRDAFLVRLDDATRPLVDADEITGTAARLLGEHLGVNRCAYADVEPDEDTFNLTGDFNHGVASIVGRYRFTQFGDECLRLMREGCAYVIADAEQDPRTAAVREAYRKTAIRAVICVPLRKRGRFVAAMAVHQAAVRPWTADEVELVQLVANRCWESIERTRIARELRDSEARLQAALEAARQVAWTYDPQSDRVSWSLTAETVLGIDPDSPPRRSGSLRSTRPTAISTSPAWRGRWATAAPTSRSSAGPGRTMDRWSGSRPAAAPSSTRAAAPCA
jgi:PAS domain-containing protein